MSKHLTIGGDLKQAVGLGGVINMNDSEFITMIIFVSAMLIYRRFSTITRRERSRQECRCVPPRPIKKIGRGLLRN